MIKKLMAVFILLNCLIFVQFSSGSVHTQLVFISNTYNTGPGQGTLIFDVEAGSPTGVETIKLFKNVISLGTSLKTQFVSISYSNQLFNSDNYWVTESYSSSVGRILTQYNYIGEGGTAAVVNTSWTKILRISIVYNQTASSSSVSWYGTEYQVINTSDVTVTGDKFGIPSQLQDISLPVQMTNLSATYDKEFGVQLEWKTESETNCAGFNILKCENIDGSYEKITSVLIPGAGNTSSAQEYSYNDLDVIEGTRYWYKIEQISTDGSADSYFGPISVQVKPIPKEFALSQNYPNPFNPITKINVDLPERSNIDVKIYDLLGKEIRTLISDNKVAGTHVIEWDGKNSEGRIMPSGIYIYKMVAGDQIKIRKMTKIQ